MNILKISREAFQQSADNGKFLIIVWQARGAATTRLQEYSTIVQGQFAGAYLAQIVADEEPELAAMFGIADLPVLLMMREQVVLYCEAGLPEPEVFTMLVRRAGNLNMASIHAEIEQAKEIRGALFSRRVCPTAKRLS